jgi:hypothetical protein
MTACLTAALILVVKAQEPTPRTWDMDGVTRT